MTILTLPPSEIRYTQDSIGKVFGRCTSHPYHQIGKTLDDLLQGRCSVYDIPRISVLKQDNNYFTADNRRLWIFKKAEELGHVETIPVYDGAYISPMKWTTVNNGLSLYVRGDPGGSYWKTLSPKLNEKRHIISDFLEVERKDLSTDYVEKYHSVAGFPVDKSEEKDQVYSGFSKVNVDCQSIEGEGDKIDEVYFDALKKETIHISNQSSTTSNLSTLSGTDNKAYVINEEEIELQLIPLTPIPVAETNESIEMNDELESLDDVTTQTESIHPRKEQDTAPGYTPIGEPIKMQEFTNSTSALRNIEVFSVHKEKDDTIVGPIEDNSVGDGNSISLRVRKNTPYKVTNNNKLCCCQLTIIILIGILFILLILLLYSIMKVLEHFIGR